MSSDDRYDVPGQQSTPDYLSNAFRNIDRHYKQRYVNVKGVKKLEPTDYTNVLDLRDFSKNSIHNADTTRVITVAHRGDNRLGHSDWKWQVQPCFNESWSFTPSLNTPVAGDGAPPKKSKDAQPNNVNETHKQGQEEREMAQTDKQKFYTKKFKSHKDQFAHPFHQYNPDFSGICGSTSSKIYAVDQVPGLFVISRALHYTSQIVWALRCFLTYEKDYTNLYNLFFVLPEKGVKDDGLETVPDQAKLPDELKVNQVADIQELFLKACAVACRKQHPKLNPLHNSNTITNQGPDLIQKGLNGQNTDVPNPNPAEQTNPPREQSEPMGLSAPTSQFHVHSRFHEYKELKKLPLSSAPALNTPQSTFHTENEFNLVALKRLRWASLGYHYDWTDREYNDHNKDPFPQELSAISQSVIEPLVSRGLITPLIPEAGIVNYYPVGSRMGAHMDDAELAVSCPIVSFSVGLSAVFVIGNQTRTAEPVQLFLRSGDCLIQDGVSRLAYHAVPRIVEDSLPFSALYQASCSLLDAYYQYVECIGKLEQSGHKPTSDDIITIIAQLTTPSDNTTSLATADPTTLPNYVPPETLAHFIELMTESLPMFVKYGVSIEQVITFLLHVLCEYRINFNTRQVQEPKLGLSLAEVRQTLRNREEQLASERNQAKSGISDQPEQSKQSLF